jgi:hypothetical protein
MKTSLVTRLSSLVTAIALASASAIAAVTVTDITARQRWPWNGLVDIDFTISGPVGDIFAIDIDATAAGGATSLSAKTYTEEPIVGVGQNRVVWDLGADYPGFRANDFRVSVTATPISESRPLYLKIDLSGGPDATKYPVTYTFDGPAHVMGAMNEPCQTTELWLRRIPHYPTAIPFHRFSYDANNANNFYGKLTKDYYIGVFELTQRQYELVMGDNPSYFTNQTCYASRPVECLYGDILYGGNINIQRNPGSISASSFFGKLRSKTGLPLAVPSSMQAEYALRGGYYTGEYYRYKIYNDLGALYTPSANDIGRWASNVATTSPTQESDTSSGTATVGSYLPNLFGLYDTMGNVYELTCEYVLNWANRDMSVDLDILRTAAGDDTLGTTLENPVIDYIGQNKSGSCWRTIGGGYTSQNTLTIWNDGWNGHQIYASAKVKHVGLRISMTVE